MDRDERRHIIGSSNQPISFLPKLAGKKFTPGEKASLVNEAGDASNKHKLQLEGTHYVNKSKEDLDVMTWSLFL